MKKIVLALLMILTLCMLTGCGQKEASVASTLGTPLKDLVTLHVPGAADMMEMPLTDLEDYMGIEPAQYTEAVYLQEGTLSGGEVLVLRAANGTDAESIKSCLEAYLTQRCKETQNYLPEAYKLLKECSVQRKNNTVALIVTEKPAEITALVLAGE